MVAKKPAPASEYYNLAFTHDNYTKITSCGVYLIRKSMFFFYKLRSEMNRTKESPKILLMESSGNNLISLSVFYLIM